MATPQEIADILAGPVAGLAVATSTALASARGTGTVQYVRWGAASCWKVQAKLPPRSVPFLQVYPGGMMVVRPARDRHLRSGVTGARQ